MACTRAVRTLVVRRARQIMHIHVHDVKSSEILRLPARLYFGPGGVAPLAPRALPGRISRIVELRLGRSSLEPNEPAIDIGFHQPFVGCVSEFLVKFLGIFSVQRTRRIIGSRSINPDYEMATA